MFILHADKRRLWLLPSNICKYMYIWKCYSCCTDLYSEQYIVTMCHHLMCYFDNKMSHSIVQPSILQCTLLNHDYVNNKNTVVLSTQVSSACTTIMLMHGNLGFINAEQLCWNNEEHDEHHLWPKHVVNCHDMPKTLNCFVMNQVYQFSWRPC